VNPRQGLVHADWPPGSGSGDSRRADGKVRACKIEIRRGGAQNHMDSTVGVAGIPPTCADKSGNRAIKGIAAISPKR